MAKSRSIIGESFKPYVKDQIKIRQEKLSIQDRDPDLLKYISNKTSWVRLSSGVDIDFNKAKELNVAHFSGNLLAKKSVLFSSRKYLTYSNDEPWIGEFTQGVGYNLENPSYGYTPGIGLSGNDLKETENVYGYGLNPPPGILSAEIKSLGKGSLREATVQISCHSLAQFKIIEALYLKLKYSMLLEWGHTMWYDNEGILRSDMPNDVHQNYLNGNYDQDSLLEDLENRRKSYCGNYDAFLGYVKNFDWSLRKDGGYDITLSLITIGDVIESLKINTNYPSSNKSTSSQDNKKNLPPIIANKTKSTIHRILYAIQKQIDIDGFLDGFLRDGYLGLCTSNIVSMTKHHTDYDLINANYINPKEYENKANNILTYQEGIHGFFKNLRTDEDGDATGGKFYYIKLGTLLRIIESFLLKYDTLGKQPGSYKPIFYIDHDYDTNLCLTVPKQISTDPKICLLKKGDSDTKVLAPSYKKTTIITYSNGVPKVIEETLNNLPNNVILNKPIKLNLNTYIDENNITHFVRSAFENYTEEFTTSNNLYSNLQNDENKGILSDIGNFYRVDGYPFLGKFMHIHVNLDFISETLSNNIDGEGKVSLYNFLEQIMKGIQQSTGYINNFEITYDEVTNYFVIRDLNMLPGADKLLNRDSEIVQFNANILTSNIGSFVTDVTIKSGLNNSFASIISIGAQANANKVGENATSLSRLNSGFLDRLLKDKSSIIDQENIEINLTGSKDPSDVYKQNLYLYDDVYRRINNGNINIDDISNNTQALTDLFKYELGFFTEKGNIPGATFIPLNLQLTMDGLSGPRIFETYTIDETLLPDNYKNSIQFITKGVNHKIDTTGWYTTLESFSGPRRDKLMKYSVSIDKNINSTPKTETIITNNTSSNNVVKDAIIYLTNTLSGGVQAYGSQRSGGSRKHAGVDIDISGPNAEMVSFIGGKVIKTGYDPGGYGKYVDIYNESLGVVERIAEAKNILINNGSTVTKGQVIAKGESNTGVIHYEIRYKPDYDKNAFGYDTTTNPLNYLTSNNFVRLNPYPFDFSKTEIIFEKL